MQTEERHKALSNEIDGRQEPNRLPTLPIKEDETTEKTRSRTARDHQDTLKPSLKRKRYMTNDKTMTVDDYLTFMRMLELFEAPDGIPPTLAEILNDLNIGNAAKLTKMVDLAEDIGLITCERLPTGKREKRTTRSVEDWRERLYLFLCDETREELAAELLAETYADQAMQATWESLGRGFTEHEPDQTYGAADG